LKKSVALQLAAVLQIFKDIITEPDRDTKDPRYKENEEYRKRKLDCRKDKDKGSRRLVGLLPPAGFHRM
jgi:hypothetical protein